MASVLVSGHPVPDTDREAQPPMMSLPLAVPLLSQWWELELAVGWAARKTWSAFCLLSSQPGSGVAWGPLRLQT